MKNILLIEKYLFNLTVGKETSETEMDMPLVVINNIDDDDFLLMMLDTTDHKEYIAYLERYLTYEIYFTEYLIDDEQNLTDCEGYLKDH